MTHVLTTFLQSIDFQINIGLFYKVVPSFAGAGPGSPPAPSLHSGSGKHQASRIQYPARWVLLSPLALAVENH